jgi:hypothetical protein
MLGPFEGVAPDAQQKPSPHRGVAAAARRAYARSARLMPTPTHAPITNVTTSIGCLPARIEEREKQPRGDAAGQCGRDDLERKSARAARATMSVSQMPLAAGTCGH